MPDGEHLGQPADEIAVRSRRRQVAEQTGKHRQPLLGVSSHGSAGEVRRHGARQPEAKKLELAAYLLRRRASLGQRARQHQCATGVTTGRQANPDHLYPFESHRMRCSGLQRGGDGCLQRRRSSAEQSSDGRSLQRAGKKCGLVAFINQVQIDVETTLQGDEPFPRATAYSLVEGDVVGRRPEVAALHKRCGPGAHAATAPKCKAPATKNGSGNNANVRKNAGFVRQRRSGAAIRQTKAWRTAVFDRLLTAVPQNSDHAQISGWRVRDPRKMAGKSLLSWRYSCSLRSE